MYQWWHPKNSIHKVDGNVVHSIGTAGNELWATGEWSETGQGKTGEPIPIKGHWFFIFVREADDWKVRVTGGNVTLDSVILINKSFAPQPAATPSPTASPGTLPTYAQQRDVTDPQTTQKVIASFKGFVEARNDNDAAAVAAYYTRDAVFLTPVGPIIGREAIQKWYADMYGTPETKPYLQGGRECLSLHRYSWQRTWATGEWSDIGQGKNGEPLSYKGYYADILVREGDGWKVRVDAWNVTPDTVILIDKSFAPQPAATPSPTASPSTQ